MGTLEVGKHVLEGKPISNRIEEAGKMVVLSARKKVSQDYHMTAIRE